jgi:hypothetical protein
MSSMGRAGTRVPVGTKLCVGGGDAGHWEGRRREFERLRQEEHGVHLDRVPRHPNASAGTKTRWTGMSIRQQASTCVPQPRQASASRVRYSASSSSLKKSAGVDRPAVSQGGG